MPIAETLGALNELVQAGKVREIGSSNFSAEQIRSAEGALKPGAVRFVSVQNHYSLLHREPEESVLPECERLGLAFLPFFPVERGLLTGKYRQGQPIPQGTRLTGNNQMLSAQNLAQVEELIQYAESHQHTILDLAISWLLARPVVASVIAGASTPEQVRANVSAAGWQLTDVELREIGATQPFQ